MDGLTGRIASTDLLVVRGAVSSSISKLTRLLSSITELRSRRGSGPALAYSLYSPDCVEGEFCELRPNGVLRASVNRDGGRMKNGHELLHYSGSSSRFPNRRSMPRARTRSLPHRAHLGAVSCPPARAKDEPSARVSPLAHPREGRLR